LRKEIGGRHYHSEGSTMLVVSPPLF